MAGLKQYVKDFGDISFEKLPFGDADSFVLCNAFYAPLEIVVSDEFEAQPVSLSTAALDYYAACSYKYKTVGLILPPNISKLLVSFADKPRYGKCRVTAARAVLDYERKIQFAACTIILPTGENVIVFRGTDDTFAGWLEDVEILKEGSIPSFQLASEYLKEAAEHLTGDFIIIGHSKGGIVALSAALGADDETFDRIKAVYNNEGPGFADYSKFSTPRYRALLPKYRHIVPHASFIGMLLAHDDDFNVVKSSKHIGLVQHDITTWQIIGTQPVYIDELTDQGKIYKLWFERVLTGLSKEQVETIYDLLCSATTATGMEGLLPFVKNFLVANSRIIKDVGKVAPEIKRTALVTNKYIGKVLLQTMNDILLKKPESKFIRHSSEVKA